jgi:ligand-binding sensor domain-containing protein
MKIGRELCGLAPMGGGLNLFNRQQNKFIHYIHDPENPNSLSNDQVRAIYEDSIGRLWVGTREGFNLGCPKQVFLT